jgi:hypothetical protein
VQHPGQSHGSLHRHGAAPEERSALKMSADVLADDFCFATQLSTDATPDPPVRGRGVCAAWGHVAAQ